MSIALASGFSASRSGSTTAIVFKTSAVVEPLREALKPLAKAIDIAAVYGSVAKGEDRADSDIDLLVVASDVTLEQLFARLSRAEKTLGRKINPTLYTPEEFRSRIEKKNPFVDKLLHGKTLPLIGDIDAFAAAR